MITQWNTIDFIFKNSSTPPPHLIGGLQLRARRTTSSRRGCTCTRKIVLRAEVYRRTHVPRWAFVCVERTATRPNSNNARPDRKCTHKRLNTRTISILTRFAKHSSYCSLIRRVNTSARTRTRSLRLYCITIASFPTTIPGDGPGPADRYIQLRLKLSVDVRA